MIVGYLDVYAPVGRRAGVFPEITHVISVTRTHLSIRYIANGFIKFFLDFKGPDLSMKKFG